jgi:hypothetical protein
MQNPHHQTKRPTQEIELFLTARAVMAGLSSVLRCSLGICLGAFLRIDMDVVLFFQDSSFHYFQYISRIFAKQTQFLYINFEHL